MDDCPNLHIVITSNKGLNQMTNIVHPVIKYVQQLKNSSSAELFLETLSNSRKKWNNQDIYDMILADKHYPIRKLLENHKTKRIFPD